ELVEGEEPIFDRYNLEIEISRALQKKVWLKSGGYIVIEHTEALTSIDVNTGRYVGKHNFEETILKTNLEAVKEICYQLRLRNIGGIIIIDFIDMDRELNREKVYNALAESLKADKARTNVLKISELGLVQMTRKRTRENILRLLSEPCPYCDGRGFVKGRATVCSEVFRAMHREARRTGEPSLVVHVHPDIADMFYEEERTGVEELERKLGKMIIIKDQPSFHIEQFEVFSQ
ncbi:MAG: ribonuclease E/G, partial [Deltaproteobacteria bacterium]|nr:ribonuclease E/G [Deltaproteobacteria bacterium]